MKILAASDLHGDKFAAQELAEKGAKEKVDLVLLAGDFVDSEGKIDGLIGPFKDKNLEVGIIPGNWDGLSEIGFMVEKYGAKNLHGYVLRKGDIGIFGCGYGNVGIHQLSEEDVLRTLRAGHEKIKDAKTKIMLTHIHPKDSIFGLGIFPGSEGIKKALDEFKPDVHLCGHMHEMEGIEEKIGNTRVINVGKKGKILEF